MKRLLILLVCLATIGGIQAQTKPAPKTTTTAKKKPAAKPKKSTVKKVKTTSGGQEFDELICYEDGPCTFNILKGDTLVYEVNAAGKQYNLFVIPNKFESSTVADFNWVATAPESKSGHVTISAAALKSGRRYLAYLPAGELKLTDASAIWMGQDNFKEITKKKTSLTLDNGQPENFVSPDEDAVTIDINYKGKPISLEGFSIQSKPEGEPGRKEIWILNISNNLLMMKMDVGLTMQLKEVREKKR